MDPICDSDTTTIDVVWTADCVDEVICDCCQICCVDDDDDDNEDEDTCHNYNRIGNIDPTWETDYERNVYIFNTTMEFRVEA